MNVMAYDMKCMTEDFTVIREEVHECYGISMQEVHDCYGIWQEVHD